MPLAGVGADLAQPGAAAADDDGLLARALDEDVDPDVEQRLVLGAALPRQHLLDDDGQRVRQLVADALERGLADELGDHHHLRLVGEHAVGVELRATAAGRTTSTSRTSSTWLARHGRARDDRVPVAQLVDGDEVLGEPLAVDGVGLGRDGDDRAAPQPAQLLELVGDEGVARPDPLVGRAGRSR